MITLHHLNFSRSTRVLWLLEELGLPYDLIRHERDAQFRAPPSLLDIHPLGKAPVIVDGDLVLAESAVILSYLNDRYGEGRLSPPVGGEDEAVHAEWLQYAESSAAFPIMMTLIGGMTGGLPDNLANFTRPELTKALDYIAGRISPGPFLMGEAFTLADIQMSYLLEMARYAGMLQGYKTIVDYLDRLKSRPAFEKALEIGGPMAPPKAEPR